MFSETKMERSLKGIKLDVMQAVIVVDKEVIKKKSQAVMIAQWSL